jgi:hypothetical protein
MTDDNGQALLRDTARELTTRLIDCEAALRLRGGFQQMQHNEFAWRVRLLGNCLDSALRAASTNEYPAALALLRTALEHQVFDRLLFLASRHIQVIEGVSDEVWERWQTRRPEFLLEWERLSKDRVRAVWRGARVVDDKGEFLYFLSIYYKWWKDYDPLVAPERDAAKLASGYLESPTARAAYARTQREMWRDVLAWKNLKESLLLNELASETEIVQLDVHHRFLSMYTHPFTEDLTDRLYGRNLGGRWPLEDHYAEELVLLYVCTVAADELRDFERMTEHEPRVDLAGWDAVRREVATAEAQIEHFWAPGRRPFSYDRAKEANQRVFDVSAAQYEAGVPLERPPTPTPETIADDEIRYYPDPLRRLVQLHAGFSEITTGVSWPSPWPRRDARLR